MIAYAAGRVVPLTVNQQNVWAGRAVSIVAVIAVLGMVEVFLLGNGPRAILYSQADSRFTSDGGLNAAFFAESSSKLRETATMISPPFFALLCMVALIIWWTYRRNPLPAAMITAGLVCAVTRSAWMGTALAISLIAFRTKQKKRFLGYAALTLALFAISIPVLGLTDYLAKTKSGEEGSEVDHVANLITGAGYVVTHPLGAGPGNYVRPAGALHEQSLAFSAPWIESTYLMLAAEYGIPAGLGFA